VLAAISVLVAIGLHFAFAYWDFATFVRAASAGDRQTIADRADFATLRENLSAQYRARILDRLQTLRDASGQTATKYEQVRNTAFAEVDSVINTVITPEGLSQLAGQSHHGADHSSPCEGAPTKYRFVSISRFRVVCDDPGSPTWTMEATGPFSWRLVSIDLPVSVIDSAISTR
jgi:hypothetical protein